jgi:putative hydrolase of the HAD superfamily
MSNIRAIFFDLGKTLIYPKAPWQAIYLKSDKALTEALISHGVTVNPNTFPYELIERLNRYYADRDETLRETTTHQMLTALLEEKGFKNVPSSIIRAALDAKYAVTQSNWYAEMDAYATLQALQLSGYKLALVSNAGDDRDVQALLDTHKLRQYFSFIRTSAASGYRKPHPQLFEEALHEFDMLPEQCAMVGDNLDADIRGANELGIYSIWINRRVNKNTKTLLDVHPKAVIQSLTELPNVLYEAQS